MAIELKMIVLFAISSVLHLDMHSLRDVSTTHQLVVPSKFAITT